MPFKDPKRYAEYQAAWSKANRHKYRARASAHHRAYMAERPEQREKLKQYHRLHHVAHADKNRAKAKKWYGQNLDRAKATRRAYKMKRPALVRAHNAARRALKRGATPPWANLKAIQRVYELATSRGLTVDHIVPLKHSHVCGLHLEWNLQLLTSAANTAKHNRFTIGLQ